MPIKYVTAEVEVDLSEFDTDDLIEELENREMDFNTKYVDGEQMRLLLETIWQKRRIGQDYQRELDDLIKGVLGKVV
jgi:hypothetical protein